MTDSELQKLRKSLPKGARKLLAGRFNCHVGHVAAVLSGTRKNDLILIAAAELASEHLSRVKEATEFIQSL